MSIPTAIRGPCFRLLTLGTALVFAAMPGRLLAQETASDPASAPASPHMSAEQARYTGFVTEPRLLNKSLNWIGDLMDREGSSPSKSGFFVDTSNMITGAGWISAGPGYRQTLFDRHAFVEASTALSWRFYKVAQARFEFTDLAANHVSIGSQVLWRDMTQVQYWGAGPDTLDESRSQYRVRTTDVVGYARVRPKEWLTFGAQIGYLRRPELREATGWFERTLPSTFEMFPNDVTVRVTEQPNFLHGGVSVTADTRNHRGHPTRGGIYRAAWTTLRDQDSNRFSFHRYEAEGAHFIPLADDRWVFAFRGWAVLTDIAPDRDVPFYLMPSLGGSNTLRAYSDYRFHDRNMVVINAESRWAVFTHLDIAAFFDAGNVAAEADDLNFDKTSYGLGFRLHTQRTTLCRIDVARGGGGWNLLFRRSEPLHLKRLGRLILPVPFVP